MKLPLGIKRIEVFYDGRCGMCCTFHEWINRQERAYEVRFVPYQSPEAEGIFPGVGTLDPAREMIVRTEQGEVFRAAEGWVLCLNSCANYREAARKLSNPYLLPVAKSACALLAGNRHGLSKIFFRKKDKEVRKQLHEMTDLGGCQNGACQLSEHQKIEQDPIQ
jgi:predicted DCC family thiol-disulfide oxidoreductase YuxK